MEKLTKRTSDFSNFTLSKSENKQHFDRVYTGDLRDVTDPETLLVRARTDVEFDKGQKGVRAHDVRWPQGAKNVIRRVPIDERSKNEADKWVQSNEPALQAEGRKALQQFAE